MPEARELSLAPRPRHLEIVGQGPPLNQAAREVHVPGLTEEEYEIDVTETEAVLRYSRPAGLRHGRQLLEQVRRQCVERWPGLQVRDWPDFPVRGFMLDVSRGRVPTRETLQRLVEVLSSVRVNHLQLYTEHTFAYADHEAVWRNASPLTHDDVRWLDELCTASGIELAANQNCFGHMEHWLATPEHRDRAELPEGFELFGVQRPAATLRPTPANAEFALGLLEELLPQFSSRRVNIGCDETWELGRGASAAEVEAHGKGRVYLAHLQRLLEPLLDGGYQPQFWGDIIANHPELVSELPDGATAVAWDYEAAWPAEEARAVLEAVKENYDLDFDFAAKIDGFDSTAAPFADSGYRFWVAPGTSSWLSLVGRVDNAEANLRDAAQVGLARGASGYLIADWGDRGHLQPPSVSFGPAVYGACVSWAESANRDLDVDAAMDLFVFDDPTRRLSQALRTLGGACRRTGQTAFNASPLHAAAHGGKTIMVGQPDPDQLRPLIDDIDGAIADLAASDPHCSDAATVVSELTAAARLTRHGALRQLKQAGVAAPPDDVTLRRDLTEAIALHRQAWALRSRPGGIERGLAGLEATLEEYQA